MQLVEKIRKRLRISTDKLDIEISDLVESGKKELEVGGVYERENDALYFQALVLYCKANFGFYDNSEKFENAFYRLRDSMAVSGEYIKKDDTCKWNNKF